MAKFAAYFSIHFTGFLFVLRVDGSVFYFHLFFQPYHLVRYVKKERKLVRCQSI